MYGSKRRDDQGRLALKGFYRRAGHEDMAHSLFLHHDLDDLLIGLAHTVAAKLSDIADGILDALAHDAVAAAELLALPGCGTAP